MVDIYTNKAKHAIILRHPLYGDKRSTLAPDIINIVRYQYYENSLKLNGLMAEQTIRTGLWYANALILRHRGIEAQRLIEKLVTASHCVHGPGHNYTCVLMNGLKIARNTATWMNDANSYISRPSDTKQMGEVCVVTGHIKEPREKDDEDLCTIPSHLILPKKTAR